MDSARAAQRFRALADKYYNDDSPGKAFYYYCHALKIKPEWLDSLRTSFANALCAWGKVLENDNQYQLLFSCYEQGLQFYPYNELILNNLGAHLCRLQLVREALGYFKKALSINSGYLPAFINAEVAKSMLVERWHFRMLNDSTRNESYRRAIEVRVREGESVLDIGSGTGLLSVYAAQAGAANVYACDFSEIMAGISEEVLRANDLLDSVTVINKHSSTLSIPTDLPHRVSVVVTETFDGGLLGEHILQTLIHAWEKLLQPPNHLPRVIPSAARLYIAPIQALQVARKYCIIKSHRLPRESFQIGIDLSKLCLSSKLDEPYDTENLKNMDFSFLSAAEKLFDFNFNDVCELKKYSNGEILRKLRFNIQEEGFLDAFAVWFDLILCEENSVTSSPLSKTKCCWEQAIFPLKEYLRARDMNVTFQATCCNGVVSLSSEGKVFLNETNPDSLVPPPLISYLNCESMLMTNIRAFEKIRTFFGARFITVLDLSVFPYLSSLIAQKMDCRVFYSNQNSDILNGTNKILQILNTSCEKMICLEWSEVAELIEEKKQMYDVIIGDVFEKTGQISEEAVGILSLIRDLLTPGGLFLPSQLQIWCQLVYSEEFTYSSQVDSSLDPLHIPRYINEYKVSSYIDFNLHEAEYEEVSPFFMIGSLDTSNAASEVTFEKEVEASKSGDVNAIIYWYRCRYAEGVEHSTSSPDSHINHAAALLETPLKTARGSKLTVKLQYVSGGLRFFCHHSTSNSATIHIATLPPQQEETHNNKL